MTEKKGASAGTEEKVLKAEDFSGIKKGNSLKQNISSFLNTNITGSAIVFQFEVDLEKTRETQAGATRHCVILKKYDPTSKTWSEPYETGFPMQVYEHVKAGRMIIGGRYMVTYTGKKPNKKGTREVNQFDVVEASV